MQLSSHSELIAVMRELWTLLDTLAIVKHGASLQIPPPDTGVHPASIFCVDAALAAGFTLEAVTVMSALPYLHDSQPDSGQRAVELSGSTFPLSYLHSDEGDFNSMREIYGDAEEMLLPADFRLMWQNIYGTEYIYDTEKKLVYIWQPMNDDCECYLDLQPVSPRRAFQPIIDRFRGLRHLVVPDDGLVETNRDSSPQRWQFGSDAEFHDNFRVWEAVCRLTDIYLESGWEVNATTQTTFRTSEFVEKRGKYMSEVVEPLKKEANKQWQYYMQHPELRIRVDP